MTVSRIAMAGSGPEFSRFVLGLWRLAEWQMSTADLLDYINGCLELGVTTFDHADIYGDYTCEEIFGRALAQSPGLRDRMELVTKCDIKLISPNRPKHRVKSYDTSRAHIINSVENSLKMLHTETIDLLLLHRPDPLMDADEVAEAFVALKQAGKVQHFGVSNFTPFQFDLLASRLDFPLVTNQIELSVMQMQAIHDGTLDQCQQRRIAPMAWSPFGGGDIFTGQDERAVRLRNVLKQVGSKLGDAAVDQVALAWLLRHPARVVPVLGSGKLHRIENAVAAEKFTLSREQWFAIWQASAGHEVP